MLPIPEQSDTPTQLLQRIRAAGMPNHSLVARILADACPRATSLRRRKQADALESALAAGAWTDVALALITLELPGWIMRRMMWDDGVWLCALSRTPTLPIELDDIAETSHAALPLAMIAALLEAKRMSVATASNRPGSVPAVHAAHGHSICCDNFAR